MRNANHMFYHGYFGRISTPVDGEYVSYLQIAFLDGVFKTNHLVTGKDLDELYDHFKSAVDEEWEKSPPRDTQYKGWKIDYYGLREEVFKTTGFPFLYSPQLKHMSEAQRFFLQVDPDAPDWYELHRYYIDNLEVI